MRSRNRNNTTDLDHEIPNWTVVRTSHTHFKSLRNEGTIHSINNETAPTTYKIAVPFTVSALDQAILKVFNTIGLLQHTTDQET